MQSVFYDDQVIFFFPDIDHASSAMVSYLSFARKKKGLSQTDLSSLCGFSRNAISDYERGLYCPSFISCCLIVKAFGFDPNNDMKFFFEFLDLDQANSLKQELFCSE